MIQPLSSQSFSTSVLAAALGISPQAVAKRARAKGWEKEGLKKQGGGFLWKFSSLDDEERQIVACALLPQRTGEVCDALHDEDEYMSEQWREFEKKTDKVKNRAAYKFELLFEAWQLHQCGMTLKKAFALVASQRGERVSNLRNWYFGTKHKAGVRGLDPKNWLPVLADKHKGRIKTAPCDEKAWDFFIADYMRLEQPTLSSSYERLYYAAQDQNWIIPSCQTLRRWVKRDFEPNEINYLRTGKVGSVYPSQQRRRDTFAAGEAVSGDGLKFDSLYIRWPDGEVLNTTTAWFWEDIHSAKILAYDVDKTENTDCFRRATYKLIGITLPVHAWVDNTMVAANKAMNGQAPVRYRFGSKDSDPVGFLKYLGINGHFTNPDQEKSNPGAKPIERAFGKGGIHERVRMWPAFKNRGFSKATAIPLAEFLEALDQCVIQHNAKPGRRGGICNGRSFDAVFAESFATAKARKPSEMLRNLLTCDQEVRKVSREGTVTINAGKGYGRHTYFGECLAVLKGERVAVMFNPDDLTAQVKIHDLQGRYLGTANWMPSVAFNSKEAGREYARERTRRTKLIKQTAKSTARMSQQEYQQLNVTLPRGDIPEPAHTTTVLGPAELHEKLHTPVSAARMKELQENMRKNIANMA